MGYIVGRYAIKRSWRAQLSVPQSDQREAAYHVKLRNGRYRWL